MHFEMPYTDRFGGVNPKSYWKCEEMSVNMRVGSGTAVFNGYIDAAAYAARKEPVGRKSFTLSGIQFAPLKNAYEGGSTDIFALSYPFAKSIKDVPNPVKGQPVLGFFDTATFVELN